MPSFIIAIFLPQLLADVAPGPLDVMLITAYGDGRRDIKVRYQH